MINNQLAAPRRPLGFSEEEPDRFWIIDQRYLPHRLIVEFIDSSEQAANAIVEMRVRGAPLIGITAAWGLYLACREVQNKPNANALLEEKVQMLKSTRPTAVNLAWALNHGVNRLLQYTPEEWVDVAKTYAQAITEDDVDRCRRIGLHGLELIRSIADQKPKGQSVRVLTHCNAGRIACIEYGTATAPIYLAHEQGIQLEVWVDETRPRNQGALTAWELAQAGITCKVIVDNAGGLLMRQGLVDMVLVGADRVSLQGDVANKIGTYLKALAAADCEIPFYVALPASTFDPTWQNAEAGIEIEERDASEVLYVSGIDSGHRWGTIQIYSEGTSVANPGFDVTPARLITGLITERGLSQPNPESILRHFPEFATANG
jgi:methylthioribose-1-phosphate isomerase